MGQGSRPQRLPKSGETSEGVWSPLYAGFAEIFAPQGLDSIAQGGNLGQAAPFCPTKAQRAVTRLRQRVTARWALKNVWLAISQGCTLGFRVWPRWGRRVKTCVQSRPHSFGNLPRLRKSLGCASTGRTRTKAKCRLFLFIEATPSLHHCLSGCVSSARAATLSRRTAAIVD